MRDGVDGAAPKVPDTPTADGKKKPKLKKKMDNDVPKAMLAFHEVSNDCDGEFEVGFGGFALAIRVCCLLHLTNAVVWDGMSVHVCVVWAFVHAAQRHAATLNYGAFTRMPSKYR